MGAMVGGCVATLERVERTREGRLDGIVTGMGACIRGWVTWG